MSLNNAVTDENWSPNYSSGRPAGDPTKITIHHWGNDGQSHQIVVDHLSRPDGDSSAHYVASAGRVTQLVHDYDRAWHAGPSGNPLGIGIECRPEMSDKDFATVAELVAAIRKEWGNLPLTGHKDYMNTACPGRWYSQLKRLSDLANAINNGGSRSVAVTQPAKAATNQVMLLTPDEYWGTLTTRALEFIHGINIDDTVSSQDAYWKSQYGNHFTSGWEWVNAPVGSQLIMKLQTYFQEKGATITKADGLIGPEFVAAMCHTYRVNTLAKAVYSMQIDINNSLKKRGIQ